jgi:hypothetical protein
MQAPPRTMRSFPIVVVPGVFSLSIRALQCAHACSYVSFFAADAVPTPPTIAAIATTNAPLNSPVLKDMIVSSGYMFSVSPTATTSLIQVKLNRPIDEIYGCNV